MSSVTVPPQFVNAPLGQSYGLDNVSPPVYLGGATLSSNAAAFPSIAIPGYNTLEIRCFIAGFSGSDVAIVQFNGDTGNNYWNRNVSVAQGATLNTNAEAASAAGITVGIAGTKGVMFRLMVGNFATVSKPVNGSVSLGSGAAATVMAAITSLAGEWINTTAQITSVLVKVTGANNFLAGSSVSIYGGV